MEFITSLQCRFLNKIALGPLDGGGDGVYEGKSKLAVLLGDDFLATIKGKVVVDFGCGEGLQAMEMCLHGAKRVIGIDTLEESLDSARRRAIAAGLENKCVFQSSTNELADIIVSLDSFEHFADPAEILSKMSNLLKPGGEVVVSFGPTWYHPLGGHLFSVFPWAHLVFSEKALIRWRSNFKTDGASCFKEVAGGLNQITIAKFKKLVEDSPFEAASFALVPIRKFQCVHNRWTREFTTAVVRCRLVKRANARAAAT